MEDVHMEEAGHATGTAENHNATSSEPSLGPQDTSGSISTSTASAQQENSMDAINGASNVASVVSKEQSHSSTASEQSAGASTSKTSEQSPGVKEDDSMMMDVDTTIPAEGVRSKAKDSHQTNGTGHDPVQARRSDASDPASKEPTQKEEGEDINPSTSTGVPSSDTTAAVSKIEQSSPTDSQSPPSDSNPSNNTNTEKDGQPTTAAGSSATGQPSPETAEARSASSTTTEAAPRPPPSAPLRSYTPQFKFTTFAAMTVVPTRNVTSNFLKTEKNFVLKEMATKHRHRKRKAGTDAAQDGEETADGEGKGKEEETEETESTKGILKKKKSDEFSAIRKGIFAEYDEDDNDKDGEDEEEVKDRKDDDEDENEGSSESDSETSVVNETDENGEAKSSLEAGKKIIVIHPGSRILRIGRASDAYPIATPHCIARRIRAKPTASAITNGQQSATAAVPSETSAGGVPGAAASTESSARADQGEADMDVDGDEDGHESDTPDFVNDKYLEEIEADLKLRMRAAKRRPVGNAKSQQRSFNTSTEPERILDHNDPYKVEWTDPAAEGEFIIGQKALNLPPSKNHNFKLFWPIVGGKLNDQDYPTPRVAIADLEAIWTKVIQEDLGIEPKKFMKHYAILVIPDLYNKLYIIELVNMLLKSMQFKGVMIQQESVCACYGAGVSTACVVDIGAEVTKVSCVEDGICLPNSRAMLKYGGDDITRCFTSLINRTGFPYRDLDLTQTYDWRLMEELKEKWCTMNEADLTVQVYSFFVRKPEKQTEKYQLKVYDEVAISPMCLFFPGVIRRWIEQREINPSFAKLVNHEDINEDAPPISLMNQSAKKNTAAAAAVAAARAGTPSSTVAGEENNIGNGGNAASAVGTPNATPAATPGPLASLATPAPVPAAPVVTPFDMEPSVTTTDKPWEIAGTIGKDNFSSLVGLDVVVAQSISNCGSEERSKKLYGSIILVGGGGLVRGFDRVLEDRLFQALPATLTTVEKVEVLPSPRDMDPRLLVWKGASVMGKLEMAKELWIKPLEWELMGRKALRDKSLFVWSKD